MAVSGVGRRECAVADGSVIPIDADGGACERSRRAYCKLLKFEGRVRRGAIAEHQLVRFTG